MTWAIFGLAAGSVAIGTFLIGVVVGGALMRRIAASIVKPGGVRS